MTWQKRLITLALAVGLGALAWRAGGFKGLLLLFSGLVLWLLLQYTRLITVMKRAAERPIGYVDSAVMLNARLKADMPLLSVLALTRAMGERLSPENVQPEVYRWADPGQVSVTAEFAQGRLQSWRLERPAEPVLEAPSADGQPS